MTCPAKNLLTKVAQRKFVALHSSGIFPPKRVLVMRLNRLGDLVCALPLYRTLEANWPDCRVDWLLSEQNAVLAPFLKSRGKIFVLPKTFSRYWVSSSLLRALQAENYDAVFAVKGGYSPQLAWLTMAIGGGKRIGFAEENDRLKFAFTHILPPPDSHIHQVEKAMKLLEPFHLEKRSDDISLKISDSARGKIRRLLQASGFSIEKPFVVFQLSSTKRDFMRWPDEFFVSLGKKFLAAQMQVCVNALSAERILARKIAAQIGAGASAICLDDMGEFLALMGEAKIVIGTDGGGIHLAAAMGAHTVAFYAESHPVKWRPWQGEHIQFYTANRPVTEITPEKVWAELSVQPWFASG